MQQLSVGHRKRRRRALQDGVDRAGAESGAEQLAGQLDRVPAGDAVAHGKGGDRRLQARAEGTRRHLGRKLGPHLGAAVRAAQALQAVLAQGDRDRGQLGDLVAGGSAERTRSSALKRWPQAQRQGQWSMISSTASIGASRRPWPL